MLQPWPLSAHVPSRLCPRQFDGRAPRARRSARYRHRRRTLGGLVGRTHADREGWVPFSEADLPAILGLLEEMVNRSEIDDLLRRVGAPFSAPNRATMIDCRLRPALASGKVSVDMLAQLLRDGEEHGRQHVFLYRAPKAAAEAHLLEAHVRRGLNRIGAPEIFDQPRVLDKPAEPTFTEARIEYTPRNQPRALVIKRVRVREHHELVDERREDHFINIRYRVEQERAVDLIKLHADGFCEVRLQSHRKPNYPQEVGQLLLALQDLIPASDLNPYLLVKAKNHLLTSRQQLAGEVRFTGSTLKNAQGCTIQAAAGSETGNLFDSEGMTLSLNDFLQYEGYCDGSNVWLRVGEKPNGQPNWVHVLISGRSNEYALTAQCSVQEYNHVLARLREFNR